jgi:hypothetical protein
MTRRAAVLSSVALALLVGSILGLAASVSLWAP